VRILCGQKYALFVKSAYLLAGNLVIGAFSGFLVGWGVQKDALLYHEVTSEIREKNHNELGYAGRRLRM
jgi:hypothetical protein